MQQWEYLALHHDRSNGWRSADLKPWEEEARAMPEQIRKLSITQMLQRLGEQGWELVDVPNAVFFYFKRPKK